VLTPTAGRPAWRILGDQPEPGIPVGDEGQHVGRHPVGLDYWIWPGRPGGLGSSLSDLFGPLPGRALSARLPDGADPAPGVQRIPSCWCSGTRTRCCVARSAGSATSRATGCGSPHYPR
jgi:hypothetical protein